MSRQETIVRRSDHSDRDGDCQHPVIEKILVKVLEGGKSSPSDNSHVERTSRWRHPRPIVAKAGVKNSCRIDRMEFPARAKITPAACFNRCWVSARAREADHNQNGGYNNTGRPTAQSVEDPWVHP
jgi:hypothetical protein